MTNNFFSTAGEIIKYGGSTFAALIVTSLYLAADGFFIGNWIGTDGLSAMALIFPIMIIFTAFGTLFETGSGPVVSKLIGEGNKALSEKVMRSNYVCALILGFIIAVIGCLGAGTLLRFLSNSADDLRIIELAVSYLRIGFFGLPFLLTVYLTGAFMRSIDQPSHVFFLVGSTSLMNVALDAIFIALLGWGMEGAALATLLAEFLGTLISFWYFKFSRYKLSTPMSFASFEYVFQGMKIGAGFAVTALMASILEYFMNAVLLHYDAVHLLASVAISNIILTFVFLPLDGMDTGIQPLVSRLFAAKDTRHCLRVMRYTFFLTMILSFAMFFVLMIFPEELMRFFVDNNEPITDEMITYLRAMFIAQPFVGIYTWFCGIMAALEDEWRNLALSLIPLVVQVPLILILPQLLPLEYVALNYSINDFVQAVAAFLLIRPFLKKNGISLSKIFTAY